MQKIKIRKGDLIRYQNDFEGITTKMADSKVWVVKITKNLSDKFGFTIGSTISTASGYEIAMGYIKILSSSEARLENWKITGKNGRKISATIKRA